MMKIKPEVVILGMEKLKEMFDKDPHGVPNRNQAKAALKTADAQLKLQKSRPRMTGDMKEEMQLADYICLQYGSASLRRQMGQETPALNRRETETPIGAKQPEGQRTLREKNRKEILRAGAAQNWIEVKETSQPKMDAVMAMDLFGDDSDTEPAVNREILETAMGIKELTEDEQKQLMNVIATRKKEKEQSMEEIEQIPVPLMPMTSHSASSESQK